MAKERSFLRVLQDDPDFPAARVVFNLPHTASFLAKYHPKICAVSKTTTRGLLQLRIPPQEGLDTPEFKAACDSMTQELQSTEGLTYTSVNDGRVLVFSTPYIRHPDGLQATSVMEKLVEGLQLDPHLIEEPGKHLRTLRSRAQFGSSKRSKDGAQGLDIF